MRLNKLFVASLAVLALVAAACGDDEDDGAEAPAATTTTAAPAVFDVDAALDADLDNCGPAPSGDPFIIGFAGTDGTPDTPVYILQIVDGETTLAARM